MATHSSILARKIPWTKESGGLQFIESQRVRDNRVAEHTHTDTHTHTHTLLERLYFVPTFRNENTNLVGRVWG